MEPRTEKFIELSTQALSNPGLRASIAKANQSYKHSRARAIAALADWEALRERGARIKDEALARLPEYLDQIERRITARGGTVHRARTAAEAREIVVAIARRIGARTAVKSKSMVTEEIGLNEALERAGVRAVETDLGEYIVQLAGESPSHIITPAIHKTRRDIARLLHEKLGTPKDAGIPEMTQAARAALREKFLAADLGISGVNFAVGETGTLVIVENEGNARLSTTLPRVHVALMGIEKVVPRLSDLAVLLRLLTRSATGQAITTYVNFIGGPRRPGERAEPDGPEELHLVILDGGRWEMWADPRRREALRCIRCGACLNFCPVYERIGGHAYGWVYPGPIGAVITPSLLGIEEARDLPHASSLCGRCGEVCPVKIRLPELLLVNRARDVEEGRPGPPWRERLAMKLFAAVARSPMAYRLSGGLLRMVLRSSIIPRPKLWQFPKPEAETFRTAWRRLKG